MKWAGNPVDRSWSFSEVAEIYRSIKQSPASFCGLRYARKGYFASALVPLLILILIGITVPARLRHRQWAIEAKDYPSIRRIDRAFDEYRQLVGSLPGEPKDLLKRLPDKDGSIAEALRNLDTVQLQTLRRFGRSAKHATPTIERRRHSQCFHEHGR